MVELKSVPHPQFKKYIGKICDIVVGPLEISRREVTFVGRNAVGHDVIAYKPQQLVHIRNWKRVKFIECG